MPSLLITATLKEDGADRRENGLLSNHQSLVDTSPNHRSLVYLPTMPAWQGQGRDGWNSTQPLCRQIAVYEPSPHVCRKALSLLVQSWLLSCVFRKSHACPWSCYTCGWSLASLRPLSPGQVLFEVKVHLLLPVTAQCPRLCCSQHGWHLLAGCIC